MGADPAGRKILDDLRISGFEAMDADALDQLASLVH
jgi:phosphoserine aminotransferase